MESNSDNNHGVTNTVSVSEFVYDKLELFSLFLRSVKHNSKVPGMIEIYANLFSGLKTENSIMILKEHFIKGIDDVNVFTNGMLSLFKLKLNYDDKLKMKRFCEFFLLLDKKY